MAKSIVKFLTISRTPVASNNTDFFIIYFLSFPTIFSHLKTLLVNLDGYSVENKLKMFFVISFVLSRNSDKIGEVFYTPSNNGLLFQNNMLYCI